MIRHFKEKLAAKISQKRVGLAVLFAGDGRILWHSGRPIRGKNLDDGRGFSKTLVRKALTAGQVMRGGEEMVSLHDPTFPQSATLYYVKSLLILPIEPDFLLYVDSGQDSFSDEDISFFHDHADVLRKIVAEVRQLQNAEGGMTGFSPVMTELRQQVLQYAVEEEPILLLGETGTGKSHYARMIHQLSDREGEFIIFDSPAIPETLFESELFGHVKGAFTSADRDRRGLVETAANGTLFFDEVSEVPLSVQAKLLRFIETGKYRSLGQSREKSAAVRIIAASNRDLKEEVAGKRFREDLYYRLHILPICIPPLRERPDDIRALVSEYEYLLRGKSIGPGFWEILHAHSWPGNVRELINVLKRAGIRHREEQIGPAVADYLDIPLQLQTAGNLQAGPDHASFLRSEIESGKSFWDTAWQSFLDRDLNRFQLKTFLRSFAGNQGSLRDLARALNIRDQDYSRFISAINKYRVHPKQQ